MKFVTWDRRPAVLGEFEVKALLKPRPDGDWVEVDFHDVWYTAGLMEEADWRERYRDWGLDPLPKIDQTGSAKAKARP